MTAYTKISYDNGTSEWGAFVDTGYGKSKVAAPVVGDTITVTTKAGERHERIIRCIVRVYASGIKIAFVADAAVAAKARERYAAVKTASQPAPLSQTSTLSRGAKERLYDAIQNEGGEGYNPHRTAYANVAVEPLEE